MKIRLKLILSLALTVICVGLGFFVVKTIENKNTEYLLISGIDNRVIQKLRTIRKMESTYFSVNSEFCDNWDSLRAFAEQGQFVITDRKEEILVRPYGGDSIVVVIDTLGYVSVNDSLFSENEFDTSNFYLLPETNEPFSITKVDMGNDHFIEVRDPNPLNPDRKKGGKLKALKFGSTSEYTLKGNWEK